MARSFVAASNQYCWDSITTSNEPITLAAWFYPLQSNASQTIAALGQNGAFGMYQASARDTAKARATKQLISTASADSANSYTANQWNLIVCVFSSDTSRTVYLNGDTANKATETTDIGDPTIAYICVGGLLRSSFSSAFNGYVAHVGLWTAALSDANVVSLWNSGNGADMQTVEGGSLIAYWPLETDDNDIVGAYHLTPVNSPTFVGDNPFTLGGPTISSVTLSGTSQIGNTLTATVVTDQDPVDSTTYQWQKAATDDAEPGTDISGETSSTLALTYADFGDLLDTAAYVRCQAIATKNSESSTEVASDWQAVTAPSGNGVVVRIDQPVFIM